MTGIRRYPNTALLYIEFDSSQFNGSIPQISCEPRGRVIRVPDILNVDHTAIIADLVLTVQELTKQVRDLNKQVQTKEY
ncbi:TPA: hypothetical protein ACU917_001784 [Klebsiella michiganensis]